MGADCARFGRWSGQFSDRPAWLIVTRSYVGRRILVLRSLGRADDCNGQGLPICALAVGQAVPCRPDRNRLVVRLLALIIAAALRNGRL